MIIKLELDFTSGIYNERTKCCIVRWLHFSAGQFNREYEKEHLNSIKAFDNDDNILMKLQYKE